MKKLLILLASCMPIGVAAALFDYQAPVIKKEYLAKELFAKDYKPISLFKNPMLGLGYAERQNWTYKDFKLVQSGTNEFKWQELTNKERFVENTHGEYCVILSNDRDALELTYAPHKTTFKISLGSSLKAAAVPCCFKVGERFYCFLYSEENLTVKSKMPLCVSFLINSQSATYEKLTPFNGMLVPTSLVGSKQEEKEISEPKNLDVPQRIIALGKKVYFLGNNTLEGNPLCDESGKIVYIERHIALSHDSSRIAYIEGDGAQTAVVITDGEKEHKAPLASWRNRFAARLSTSVSFWRSLNQTPLNMRVSGKWYCYFDTNGAVHVGPSTSGEEEFVIAPKPTIVSWRNWSCWRWTLPTTTALVGLGVLWKTNGWKKAFSR